MTAETIEPTSEQLERLIGSDHDGPFVMINLLRFKDVADGIDAADGISGAEAYARYGAAAQQHLERIGGRVVLAVVAQDSVIGPEEPEWDLVIAVNYPSRAAFLLMVSDPEYLAIHAHRAAALADSRLIACEAVSV
jgi:uncharacterized protein (DUF1330 family)